MRVLPLVALSTVALALAVPPAQAQLETVLDVQVPYLAGEAEDGLLPGVPSDLLVPWTLTFQNAALAAAELGEGGATLTFTVRCDQPLDAPEAPQPIEHVPGENVYEGTTAVKVTLPDAVAGIPRMLCDVTGTFAGAQSEEQDTGQATVPVHYRGAIEVVPLTPARQAGPQKQIPYPLEVTNRGAGPVEVHFQVVDKPRSKASHGGWFVLAPEAIRLEPGGTVTVPVTVATPYQNGYNNEGGDIHVRAIPRFAGNESGPDPILGTPVDVTLQADVKGWYVPGPSAAFVAVSLAGLALLARRR